MTTPPLQKATATKPPPAQRDLSLLDGSVVVNAASIVKERLFEGLRAAVVPQITSFFTRTRTASTMAPDEALRKTLHNVSQWNNLTVAQSVQVVLEKCPKVRPLLRALLTSNMRILTSGIGTASSHGDAAGGPPAVQMPTTEFFVHALFTETALILLEFISQRQNMVPPDFPAYVRNAFRRAFDRVLNRLMPVDEVVEQRFSTALMYYEAPDEGELVPEYVGGQEQQQHDLRPETAVQERQQDEPLPLPPASPSPSPEKPPPPKPRTLAPPLPLPITAHEEDQEEEQEEDEGGGEDKPPTGSPDRQQAREVIMEQPIPKRARKSGGSRRTTTTTTHTAAGRAELMSLPLDTPFIGPPH